MKIMNNRVMSQFGSEAFNINLQKDILSPPRLNAKRKLLVQGISKVDKQEGYKSMSPLAKAKLNKIRDSADMDRRKLLSSLNNLADQLTRPSINEKEEKPQWLQQTLKEEAAKSGITQTNLGKPSSRQDAVLLGKWFKGIIDMIENEFQNSNELFEKQGIKKTFPTQKLSENELLKTDTFMLIQVAHNIAVKEMTRQVSVQCVERGIVLKAIFDSYVRMIDLIFEDSIMQRKLLAQKFAAVCERQVFFQSEQI